MPRAARAIVPGGTYHVLTRGNNGQAVFHHDADCQRYLKLLLTYTREHRLKVYHFALMPNHVHLVLEVADSPALSKAMHGLNLSYSLYYRKRYKYLGHLWQGRFKNLFIDRESYLLECGRYVELNPVRANLARDPREYAWSSYRTYAEGLENPLIVANPLYEQLGASTERRQQAYRQFIRDGMAQDQARRAQEARIHQPLIRLVAPTRKVWRIPCLRGTRSMSNWGLPANGVKKSIGSSSKTGWRKTKRVAPRPRSASR